MFGGLKTRTAKALSGFPEGGRLLVDEQGLAMTEYVVVLAGVSLPVGLLIFWLWPVLYKAFAFTKLVVLLPIP